MNTPESKPAKKPYRPPVLERYGHIRELTKVAAGMTGANDQVQKSNKTGI